MSALDLRLLGRLGGAGLLAGAVALFALMALPHWGTAGSGLTVAVAVASAIGGIVALRAQWSEDATRGGMVLAAGAYLGLGVSGFAGGSQAAYGPLFVVVAAWCGLALGPTYTLKLAPLALLCDTLPAVLGRPGTALVGISAIVVATVTGEIFARLADRVRRDARRDAHRTKALERLTAGQLQLARATDPTEAARIAAAVALDILDAGETAVLLERDGERVLLAGSQPMDQSKNVAEGSSGGREGTGVRGLLTAHPKPGERLDPFGQALAASLVAATCAALESIALTGRLRVRAEIDPLTGLGNRRRLDTALGRLQAGDVVIVLDLDHFKNVNDALGHDTGDEVLRSFGAHLSALTRAGELAIRTGGEEFVLIAEGGPQARGAAALLGRLSADWWRQSPLTTFSAGAAIHAGGAPTVTMKRADLALYEAKRHGRAAGWLLADPPADGPQASDPYAGMAGGRLIPFPGAPFRRPEKLADIILPQGYTSAVPLPDADRSSVAS
jgi:diguanylate cyclase (GGDEF)-like protein